MSDNNMEQSHDPKTEAPAASEADDSIPCFFFQAIARETIRAGRQIEIINEEKKRVTDFIAEQSTNPKIRSAKDLDSAINAFIIETAYCRRNDISKNADIPMENSAVTSNPPLHK